jgi:replicative DNA helicase
LTNEELVKISGAARRISESGLSICDSVVSANDIVNITRGVFSKHPIDIVVVDYCQLVRPVNGKISREQDVSNTGWQMKAIAKEMKCVVILLSQLNKEGISRESEALEMHADVILNVRKHGNDMKKYVDVAKQRNGPTGEIEVSFYPPCVALY